MGYRWRNNTTLSFFFQAISLSNKTFQELTEHSWKIYSSLTKEEKKNGRL